MKKRWLLILGGALLAGGLCLALATVFKPFEEGPRYKGLPISYWRRSLLDYSPYSPFWENSSSPLLRVRTLLGLQDAIGRPAILSGDPATLGVLLQLVRDDEKSVNRQAEFALLSLPSSKLDWRAIVKLLKDEDVRVRLIGEMLMRDFGKRADQEAVTVLGELLESEDWNVRLASARAVAEMGPEAAPLVPKLAKMLDEGWWLGPYAADALKKIGPGARPAVPALLKMLRDEDESRRRAAADALLEIDSEALHAAEKAGLTWWRSSARSFTP
jgi:HEAT repeat protein